MPKKGWSPKRSKKYRRTKVGQKASTRRHVWKRIESKQLSLVKRKRKRK